MNGRRARELRKEVIQHLRERKYNADLFKKVYRRVKKDYNLGRLVYA